MKKILPIVVIGILVLSGLGAVGGSNSENEITEAITFSEMVLQEKEDFLSVDVSEASYYTFGNGEPCLPVINRVYKFPFGTIIDDVEVTFSPAQQKQLSKKIMPAPSARIISTEYAEDIVEVNYETLYNDITLYPEERFSYRASAGLDGNENVIYLAVSAFPVQYVPGSNTVLYSDSMDIHVKFTQPEEPITFPDEYDLLIIAPEEFESALQPLVNHKNSLDPPMRTVMVALEDIPSSGGVDVQEDIKFYIRDAKETWGIHSIILVGSGVIDGEGEELFPVRKAWLSSPPHEDWFPSDAYYVDIYNSTMGFPDWDFDEDGKHAEYPRDNPDMDLVPDLHLGKLPANNAEEVTAVVNKIIHYEMNNMMTNKIGQVGGDTFVGDSGQVYEGEYANTIVMGKLPGYSTTRVWASNDELTKLNIRSAFHGKVDFMDFSGHGSAISWATHPPLNDDKWIPEPTPISDYQGFLYFDFDIYSFNNKKLPVIMYNACSNHKYTKGANCLGWATVRYEGGGGIATYAASGIGYGAQGTAEVNRVMGWMEVNIFDQLYKNKGLGLSWTNCVTGYHNQFAGDLDKTDYITLCEFSLFGDPTLPIQEGIEPHFRSQYRPLPTLIERLLDRFPLLERILTRLQ